MSNISYSAIKTILIYEIKDFIKEFQFNIIAPLINTLLFVCILSTIENYYNLNTQKNSYINFLVPGIVMMVIIQTSYNHLSEVIISMKQTGSFNDYLMSPITRIEIFISFIFSSVFVSIIVGLINLLALSYFTNFDYINYINLFYYLVLTIIIFSSLGALTGFLSFTWDVQSSVSNFFIIPISFFSGTFFPINFLSEKWQFIYRYNPFYYLVHGFRSAFDDKINISLFNEIYILTIVSIFFLSALYIFQKGYKVIY